MKLGELKEKFVSLMRQASTERRSLNEAEMGELQKLQADIVAAEKADAAPAAEVEHRSAAAVAAAGVTAVTPERAAEILKGLEARNMAVVAASAGAVMAVKNLNDFLRNAGRACLTENRSWTEAAQDVGGKEVIADVVRVFEQQSPILKAFTNLQHRSTGRTFSYTKIVTTSALGLHKGTTKSEGVAGAEDTTTSITMADITFVTYTGRKVIVSNEMLDDAAADLAKEVVTFGMAGATMKFNDAALTALKAGIGTGDDQIGWILTAGTTWDLADLSAAYFSIPNRNRYGVKYTMNGATAGKIVAQLTTWNKVFTDLIELKPENIVVDMSMDANRIVIGNMDLTLAIGIKEPVRVWTNEVSEGVEYEVQPRLAVANRDYTASVGVALKGASYS